MKSYQFFKTCKRLDKESEKVPMQQLMRKEKMRKIGVCLCFIKSFYILQLDIFFVSQAYSQLDFCFLMSG